MNDGFGLYKKMKVRFSETGFNVRKWRTNDKKLLEIINANENKQQDNSAKSCEKVLGIKWDETKDTLIIGISDILDKAINIEPTKRNILCIIASIYDPVGYLQPLVIKLKLLFQEICVLNVGWDDSIGDLECKWINIVNDLRKSSVETLYLHGFSDAAMSAYGCCIYLKSATRSGNIKVKFVTSKSRVVPIKQKFTIPRKEIIRKFYLIKADGRCLQHA